MKKTIITAALVLSATAYATEYTFTNERGTSTSTDYNYAANNVGWIQSLNASTLSPSPELPTSGTTLYLTEVTILSHSGTQGPDNFKLAVFSGGSLTGIGNTFLGLSDEAESTNRTDGGEITFTFSKGIEWTSTNGDYAAYQFVFVSATATNTEVAALAGSITKSDLLVTPRIEIDCADPESGSGLFGTYSQSYGQANSSYSALASYTLTDVKPVVAVPEPATATLSLLALAGLATRRRRK